MSLLTTRPWVFKLLGKTPVDGGERRVKDYKNVSIGTKRMQEVRRG